MITSSMGQGCLDTSRPRTIIAQGETEARVEGLTSGGREGVCRACLPGSLGNRPGITERSGAAGAETPGSGRAGFQPHTEALCVSHSCWHWEAEVGGVQA